MLDRSFPPLDVLAELIMLEPHGVCGGVACAASVVGHGHMVDHPRHAKCCEHPLDSESIQSDHLNRVDAHGDRVLCTRRRRAAGVAHAAAVAHAHAAAPAAARPQQLRVPLLARGRAAAVVVPASTCV